MDRRERTRFFLIWAFLGLFPLLLRPLWQPDEGRYAEIPREMLAAADWLTPRLNGVLYFEKPPLQYWLSAFSMRFFGLNAFAARLPLALATLITMGCSWRLARRMGASNPVWAAFMVASTLLGFICGQVLTLDALFSAFLVLSITAFIEAVAYRFDGQRATGWTLLAFGASTLSLLTKGLAGPVLLGGTIFWGLVLTWREKPLRSAVLRTLVDPWGWALFLVIGAPWFILVDRVNPGHATFFFWHEHFARFSTNVSNRQGSDNAVLDKAYFLETLLPGLVPWLSASVVGLKRGIGFLRSSGPRSERTVLHRWTVIMLLMAVAVPFLFFTVSHSKLPFYIVPVLAPICALACAFEREDEAWKSLARSGKELGILGLIFAVAGPFLIKAPNALQWTLPLGILLLVLGFWAQRPRHLTGPRWMVGMVAAWWLLVMAAQAVAGPGAALGDLVAKAPQEAQWISCGNYFQVIPFKARQRVAVVAGTGELEYGRDHLGLPERERWFQEDPSALLPMAQRMRQEAPQRPVWALITEGAWKQQSVEQRGAWEVLAHREKVLLARLRER